MATRAPGEEPSAALRAGTVVAGRFRLDEQLGEGGMGVVWKAVHLVTRKPVALKFLRREATPQAVQRVLREARAACAGGTVMHCPLAGCATPKVIARTVGPFAMALDSVSVYFTNSSEFGAVLRVAK